jgi:hypothetical protein
MIRNSSSLFWAFNLWFLSIIINYGLFLHES